MKPEAKSENAAPVKKAKAETLIQWERQMVKNQFLHPKPCCKPSSNILV